MNHDCCHILGDFNTDTQREMNVAAFQAGLFTDGFGFESLLEVMLDFHPGKSFPTITRLIAPETLNSHFRTAPQRQTGAEKQRRPD